MKLHFKSYSIPLFVVLFLMNATTIFSAVCDNTASAVEFVQPTGAHNCYNIGDLVIYQDHIYESLLNANVWAPSAYPAGWSDCGSNTIPDNTSPTDISLSSTTINDDAGTNAQVGVLSAIDNEGGIMTYRLVAGIGADDNSSFLTFNNILKAKESFHYNTKSSYKIRVEVEDDGGLKYSKEFTITVNEPDSPGEVNTVIHLPSALSDFALYSHNDMDIKQQVQVKGGSIGTNSNITLGEDINSGYATTVSGNLWANGNILVDYFANVTGDVIAGGIVTQKLASEVGGEVKENAKTPYYEIPTKTVDQFGTDLEVYYDATRILEPGNYGDVVARDRSTIQLNAGMYNFKSLDIVGHDSKLIINISKGEIVEINVKDKLAFGFRFKMEFVNETQPYAVKIYTDQTEKFILTVDSEFYGIFTAPNATVDIQRRVKVYGAIYADKINLLWNASVCKPPTLSTLAHSEWAYAPPFDPNTILYKALVSEATYSVGVNAESNVQGSTISINESSSSMSVDLDEDPKNIDIQLTGGECNINTNYTLSVRKSGEYKIHVNDNSPAPAADCDGKSWETAYKDLQLALNDAFVSGKEIWVAEGTYKPTKKVDSNDPRSATFTLFQGTEVIGGFKGDELEQEPKGSPYKTILSGDLASDDNNIVWPPTAENEAQYIDDNAYHVVTINARHKAKGIRIKGFTITGGVANGFNSESRGGGVSSEEAYPAIEECIIIKNFATSHGAGIYSGSGLQSFEKALFKDNYSASGFGAGLYVSEAEDLNLSRVVFDGNIAAGENTNAIGGALFSDRSNISFVNSIFAGNSAKHDGGAIYNNGGNLKIVNCTFTNNNSDSLSGGISNKTGTVEIINTILWNNGSNGELRGTDFTVSYSCVKNGYSGVANVSGDPEFKNTAIPTGDDYYYGSLDDGLMLLSGSSCIGKSDINNLPDKDILLMDKAVGVSGEIGAYKYLNPATANTIVWGTVYNGEFRENNNLTIISKMIHPKEIYQYSGSSYSRVIKAYIVQNEYTNSKSSIYMNIWPVDGNGNALETAITITLYNNGEVENGLWVFKSLTPDYTKGKNVIFTSEHEWHGLDNPWAYIMYMPLDNPSVTFEIPHSQF